MTATHKTRNKQLETIYWRCTKDYKLKCPAILKTENETVSKTKGTHNHDCDSSECKAKEVVSQIKRRAEYSTPAVANPKVPMIMQFNLLCPKRQPPVASSLSKTTKIGVFKYLPHLIDILISLMSLLPSSHKSVEKMIRSEF